MIPKYRNPAGRLLSILEYARDIGESKTLAIEVWRKVFVLPQDDFTTFAVTAQIYNLHGLIDEIERSITEKEPDNHALYLKSIPNIRNALNPERLTTHWNNTEPELTDAAMQGLEFCALTLPQEDEITEDEYNTLKDSFNTLFNEVAQSEISPHLKKWLLSLLSDAKRSIDLFQIHGARAFKKALQGAYGDVCMHLQLYGELKKQESLFDNFMGQLSTLKKYAKCAKDWEPLLEYSAVMLDQLPNLLN